MILINLLPHREVEKKRRKDAFQAAGFASVLVGLFFSGIIYIWMHLLIDEQQSRNELLKSEIALLDKQIVEIKKIEEEISALRGRQKAVEDLQANRNVPVNLLNQLVRMLPDGLYLKSLKQTGLVVDIQGVAQSNERVSELLRNISEIKEFSSPQLKEIVAGVVSLSSKDSRGIVNFNLSFKLLLPNQENKKGGKQ